jgi:hypothetical protein
MNVPLFMMFCAEHPKKMDGSGLDSENLTFPVSLYFLILAPRKSLMTSTKLPNAFSNKTISFDFLHVLKWL